MELSTFKNSVSMLHPKYSNFSKSWSRIRDCLAGEDKIKAETEKYLPRPAGMSGEYASAYDDYLERAHFPLVTAYALSGALGLVVTKLPEFKVPKGLEYLLKTATKDNKTMTEFFLDVVIEIFQTGRVPILVDFLSEKKEFRFVQYSAEEFINWKLGSKTLDDDHNLILGVIKEHVEDDMDPFSHDTNEAYRVLYINDEGEYTSQLFLDSFNSTTKEYVRGAQEPVVPTVYGSTLDKIPMTMAGSIDNSFSLQPIPLISVANCSIQIYRKEADLANSEFLSCNPTLVIVGASNDDDLPNVVGSSVMMVLPNEQARVFYTETDTAALTHVKDHIKDLYEEAIRHGVAILDARKGVEAAEALRIRQTTQSATIFSIYMSAVNAIKRGLEYMCEWSGLNPNEVIVDTPHSLNTGFPDAGVLKSILLGIQDSAIPLQSLYRYLIDASLLEQSVSYDDYLKMLESKELENLLKKKIKESEEGGEPTQVTDFVKNVSSEMLSLDQNKKDELKKEQQRKEEERSRARRKQKAAPISGNKK
jgi:hypothetical protein